MTCGPTPSQLLFDPPSSFDPPPPANFDLVEEADMPFLIREHVRKFQWGISHAAVWQRK